MAVNKQSITLAIGVWTDLYASAGIPVGAKLGVHNIGSSDVYLSSALLKPEKDSDSYQVVQVNNLPMTNDAGDSGAWAFSPNQQAKLNVWVVL